MNLNKLGSFSKGVELGSLRVQFTKAFAEDVCLLSCRYFQTLPYLLLRTRVPIGVSVGILVCIEVSVFERDTR